MTERIEITEEQHQAALASASGLEKLLTDTIAAAEQRFWRRSDHIVCVLIQERIPLLIAIHTHLEQHPELKGFEFVGACFACHANDPNRSVAAILADAEKLLKNE